MGKCSTSPLNTRSLHSHGLISRERSGEARKDHRSGPERRTSPLLQVYSESPVSHASILRRIAAKQERARNRPRRCDPTLQREPKGFTSRLQEEKRESVMHHRLPYVEACLR